MVVRWRYADGTIEILLCPDRKGHVRCVSFDDLVITTPLRKRYSRPLVMLW